MKVLTVYAHPNPKSFCHTVLERFTAGLKDGVLKVEGTEASDVIQVTQTPDRKIQVRVGSAANPGALGTPITINVYNSKGVLTQQPQSLDAGKVNSIKVEGLCGDDLINLSYKDNTTGTDYTVHKPASLFGGRDTSAVVQANGGTVVRAVRHPLNTADFSSFLLQAQSSGAKVIGLANAGADTTNSIKQASEFGIVQSGQQLAALLVFLTDVHALGLPVAQGLVFTEAFYWDQNDKTREFSKKFAEQNGGTPPTMVHAARNAVLFGSWTADGSRDLWIYPLMNGLTWLFYLPFGPGRLPTVVLADIVDRDDVRVIEARGGFRLLPESALGLRLRHLDREEFDCDGALELGVRGAVDDAHAAAAEHAFDAVMTHLRAGGKVVGLRPTRHTARAGIGPAPTAQAALVSGLARAPGRAPAAAPAGPVRRARPPRQARR